MVINIAGAYSGFRIGMNTRKYMYIPLSILLFVLTMPVHGWVKGQASSHDVAYSIDLALVQDGDKGHKKGQEAYRLKKYRYQKEGGRKKENNGRKEYRGKKYISLQESVSRVKKRMNGRVLSAHRYEEDDRSYYRIKVLTHEGVVRVILVDPESGDLD